MIGGVPDLAEIESTSVDHLTALAEAFRAEADVIERCFTQSHDLMGGVLWKGRAADAAYKRTDGDQMTAKGEAEQRRDAAHIAETGAENMMLARGAAMRIIGEGRAAEFEIRPDLGMVAYTRGRSGEQAMRLQPTANQMTAELRAQAASMAAIDKDTTTKLAAATAGFGTLRFTEPPMYNGSTRLMAGSRRLPLKPPIPLDPPYVTIGTNPYPPGDPRHQAVENLNTQLLTYGVDLANYASEPPPTNQAEYLELYAQYTQLTGDLAGIVEGYKQYGISVTVYPAEPPRAPTSTSHR